MFIDFIESIIYLVCVLPLILLLLNKATKSQGRLIVLFSFYFILMQFLLLLPINVSELDLIGGSWNWTGKFFATVGAIIFYYLTRHHYQKHQYVRIKQSKQNQKSVIIVFTIILVYAVIEGFVFYNRSFDAERLLFQATMPGIEEEISYRAILLGLLSTLLVDRVKIIKWNLHNPAIWIIGILFGLIHALKLSEDWGLTFNAVYFIKTFILGTLFSWMTLKTRSILYPLISHNLANFIPNMIGMLK